MTYVVRGIAAKTISTKIAIERFASLQFLKRSTDLDLAILILRNKLKANIGHQLAPLG